MAQRLHWTILPSSNGIWQMHRVMELMSFVNDCGRGAEVKGTGAWAIVKEPRGSKTGAVDVAVG